MFTCIMLTLHLARAIVNKQAARKALTCASLFSSSIFLFMENTKDNQLKSTPYSKNKMFVKFILGFL